MTPPQLMRPAKTSLCQCSVSQQSRGLGLDLFSVDLFNVLAHRRFERERSRRGADLRRAWEERELERPVPQEPEPRSLGPHESESRLPPAQSTPKPLTQRTPRPQAWWECGFCGRGFHGYGAYLNHRCHSNS
jgi:hypothetical protein